MSELNKLAGRFIYKGCWEKKKGVIEGFKKSKKKNTETNFGLVFLIVLLFFLSVFPDFRILTLDSKHGQRKMITKTFNFHL